MKLLSLMINFCTSIHYKNKSRENIASDSKVLFENQVFYNVNDSINLGIPTFI